MSNCNQLYHGGEMFMSGFNSQNIKKFLLSAIVGYERHVKCESEGGQKVHRDGAKIK